MRLDFVAFFVFEENTTAWVTFCNKIHKTAISPWIKPLACPLCKQYLITPPAQEKYYWMTKKLNVSGVLQSKQEKHI